jgi:hypothetical protein
MGACIRIEQPAEFGVACPRCAQIQPPKAALQPRNSSLRQSSERILQIVPTSDFHL